MAARPVALTVAMLVAWFTLLACGSGDGAGPIGAADRSPVADADAGSGPVTDPTPETAPELPVSLTDETGRPVTIESVERIIPLDGTVAEVVFALGLGDRVVATDLSATYPPEADALPEIGYQRALSPEPIAAFSPTVLIATDIAGPPDALDDLRTLGFPVVIVPNDATAEGPGEKVVAVAEALGVPERGRALAAEIDATITAASGPLTDTENQPTIMALYLRGDSAQVVLGTSSPTHWLIEAVGAVDAAVELGVEDNEPISAEAVVLAAPDALLVPESGLESVGGVDGLLAIPGLAETPAGRAGRVLAYDDQLLLGNGPRVGDLLVDLRRDLTASLG